MRLRVMMRLLAAVPLLGGVLALAPGCGDDNPNAKPAAPPTTQTQQDAEREAREKAMGKGGAPSTSAAAKTPTGAEAPK